MKRLLVLSVVSCQLSVVGSSSAQIPDTVNGWYLYRVVGDQSATTWSLISADTASEGKHSQSFYYSIEPNTFIEWRKDYGREYLTPFSFEYNLKLAGGGGNWVQSNRFALTQFFIQHGDTTHPLKAYAFSRTQIDTAMRPWFTHNPGTNNDYGPPPSFFNAIILRLYFNPSSASGWARIRYDNLSMHYYTGNNLDSVIVLDRFGDDLFYPTFALKPAALDFDSVLVGNKKVDSAFVKNTGTDTLRIRSVTSDASEFTVGPVPSVIAPGDSARVLVTFRPTSVGVKSGNIIFTHNTPTSPDTLRVAGIGASLPPPPVFPLFTIRPTQINFDSVRVGGSRTDSAVVRNTGTDTLRIASIVSDANEFVVGLVVTTILPGDSAKVTVTFSPAALGQRSGNIIFTHNALTSPDTLCVRGVGTTTTGVNDQSSLITDYWLGQNYPNPFNPSTVISYQLPVGGFVRLEVYNTLGQVVATLVDETKPAGSYVVRFDASNLPSGIYFYRLQAAGFIETKKLILIK